LGRGQPPTQPRPNGTAIANSTANAEQHVAQETATSQASQGYSCLAGSPNPGRLRRPGTPCRASPPLEPHLKLQQVPGGTGRVVQRHTSSGGRLWLGQAGTGAGVRSDRQLRAACQAAARRGGSTTQAGNGPSETVLLLPGSHSPPSCCEAKTNPGGLSRVQSHQRRHHDG